MKTKKSLLIKSILIIILLSTTISLLLVFWYWRQVTKNVTTQFYIQESEIRSTLAESLLEPLRYQNVKEISKNLSFFSGRAITWSVVKDSSGVAIYVVGEVPDIDDLEKIDPTLDFAKATYVSQFEIADSGNVLGKVFLGYSLDKYRSDLTSEKKNLLYVIVMSFLASIFFIGFNVSYLISRINILKLKIEKYNPELDDENLVDVNDEIDRLYVTHCNTAKNLYRAQLDLIQKSQGEALINISRQVAHDIRSPLSALTMMSDAFNSVPEEKRLIIRGAIQRINDIANDLLQKSKENAADTKNNTSLAQKTQIQQQNPTDADDTNKNLKTQIELLPAVVDLIISEKRIQYRYKMNVEITSDFSHSYGEFAEINANELKRVLSNLINNSIEAFAQQTGKIIVSITSDQNSGQSSDQNTVSIVVRDNGRGIPENILAKLGEKGISHGKEGTSSGSGLGIYHAKNTIESFNGKFEVLSRVGMGTTITMSFPKAAAPSWFVEKLVLPSGSQIISLDDDLSIHQIWKGRLQSLNAESLGVQLLSFTSGVEFKNYVEKHSASEANISSASQQKTYLIDYELLNQSKTGLDLIEELGLGKSAILVTSRYEEEHIRSRCAKLGVKLIPKGMAGFVPIEISATRIRYDLCLLDDDTQLIHAVWASVAESKGLKIKMFATPQDFFASADSIDRQTPIYVDISLGNGIKGTDVSHEIHKLGFVNINLATGYDADSIVVPAFIRQVVGKDFPDLK